MRCAACVALGRQTLARGIELLGRERAVPCFPFCYGRQPVADDEGYVRCCTSVCVPVLVPSTPTATQIASTQVTPASVALLIPAFVAPEPTCQLVPSSVVATKGALPEA